VNKGKKPTESVWGPLRQVFYVAPSLDSLAIHSYGLRLTCPPREEGGAAARKEGVAKPKMLRSSSAQGERLRR
jgi:hypothetical protein